MDKPKLHVVSLSGGKDSTAMLLMMLERRMPIDIILFCDTGLEFPAMYEHIKKLEHHIKMPITVIKAPHTYEYYFMQAPVKRRHKEAFTAQYGGEHLGYGWAGPRQRWCTNRLKDTPREQFLRPLREQYEIIDYIGLAADETYRLARKNNQAKNHVHPLVDWGMTEADCLQYCYDHGFDWDGLYRLFRRVSCWCCPLQSLSELRQLYKHYPELWAKLKDWDSRTWRKFRADYSVNELETRFNFENERLADGLPIKGRAFFDALKQRLVSNTQ